MMIEKVIKGRLRNIKKNVNRFRLSRSYVYDYRHQRIKKQTKTSVMF